MPVLAKTSETYGNSVIFEDLQNAYTMISPEETPFQQAASKGTASATLVEWPVVALDEVDAANRVPEGEWDVPNDDPTLATRLSNVTQISDKVPSVSHTAEAVDAAAENIQRLAKQVVLKMRAMKRDKETMLLANVPAIPASSGVARQAAGLMAFLRTNTDFGTGGADPTLSGTTEGYPDAGATPGTPRPFSEETLNDVIEACWDAGADPSIIMVNSRNKRIISQTFTGNASRYKDTNDKRIVNAIDIYVSDFGTLQVVPNRFLPTLAENNYAALVIDPNYVTIKYLQTMRQKPLGSSGHAERALIWCEYTLQVDTEEAHGIIRDLDGVMPTP